MSALKAGDAVLPAASPQGVGDGFPVWRVFSVHGQGAEAVSPFLLLDVARP